MFMLQEAYLKNLTKPKIKKIILHSVQFHYFIIIIIIIIIIVIIILINLDKEDNGDYVVVFYSHQEQAYYTVQRVYYCVVCKENRAYHM